MGETIKLGFRLFLFAAVAALALAATNEITKGPIAEQARVQANAARDIVLPGIEAFEEIPVEQQEQFPALQSVHRAVVNGELEGYSFLISVTGYKGPIVMTLAVNSGGSINSLVINSQTETAGLGNKISDEPFLSQFSGLAANAAQITSEIDGISGATVSSRAVLSGVEQGLSYAQEVLGVEPRSGVVITIDSVNEQHDVEERTGTHHIRRLDAFHVAGYPNIRSIYSADYGDQDAYLFEFDGESVILSSEGELLSPTDAQDSQAVLEAQRYMDQFLKEGVRPQ